MTISCIRQVALEYVAAGSDKLYVIQVQKDDSGPSPVFKTMCYYGRRGSTLNVTSKYTGASEPSANAAFDKMEREKTGKGYTGLGVPAGAPVTGMPSGTPVFGGASAASTSSAPKASTVVGPLPALATAITEVELEACMVDPDAVLQRKYDGERVVVSLRRAGIVATNRKGVVRPLSAGAEVELKKLLALPDFGDDRECVLDGELMGEDFVAFDILTLRDNDIRALPFDERFSALEELLDANLGLLAQTAWSEDEKRALLAEAMDKGWEGLIVHMGSEPYRAGRSRAILKFKLWATATCRVLTVNSKRSVQIALRDANDDEVFAGNVTVPVNQDLPEPDSLIEVRYLYALPGGSLYQPTLLGPRTDIDECDLRSSLRAAPPEKVGRPAATEAPEAVELDI